MRAMANLRYRVLPPQLLLRWPKEASFCQLMMHPVPDTRPKMRCVMSLIGQHQVFYYYLLPSFPYMLKFYMCFDFRWHGLLFS
jgi:hypothetical protein